MKEMSISWRVLQAINWAQTGLASITGGCLDGSLAGNMVQKTPHSHQLNFEFYTDPFFPQKNGTVSVLSHTSRVRNLEIVHPNLFCSLRHHYHLCKLYIIDGNLHLVVFTEVFPHDFDHVPQLNWDIHLSQENPRDWHAHLDCHYL